MHKDVCSHTYQVKFSSWCGIKQLKRGSHRVAAFCLYTLLWKVYSFCCSEWSSEERGGSGQLAILENASMHFSTTRFLHEFVFCVAPWEKKVCINATEVLKFGLESTELSNGKSSTASRILSRAKFPCSWQNSGKHSLSISTQEIWD